VVSVTDSYGRVLGFLDRSRYFFFQVAPQLDSRGRVDPVPDPLLSENLVAPGIELGPLDPRVEIPVSILGYPKGHRWGAPTVLTQICIDFIH
jgi:hypothetical protein